MRKPQLYFQVIALAYLALAWFLPNAPLQDLPNHLARAHIISDLLIDDGSRYGSMFELKPALTPYLAGDLMLSASERLLGSAWACRVWLSVTLLLLPLSAAFVLKELGATSIGALTGALMAFYPATDLFFIMGFVNYQIASALLLFAYGWFLRARVSGKYTHFAWYVLLICLSYSMHLSALVFIIALVGVTSARDLVRHKMDIRRAALYLFPPCALLLAHFAFSPHVEPGKYLTVFLPLSAKLRRVVSVLMRFDLRSDLLFAMFFLAVAIPWLRPKVWLRRDVLEPAIISAAFFGIYLVLPWLMQNVSEVDVRAMPLCLLFLAFAGVFASQQSPKSVQIQYVCAIVLACVNLFYVASEMVPQDKAMLGYRSIASMIPQGATVLPINTRKFIGKYRPFGHAGSYATLDAGALTPYLFAADSSSAQLYFLYRRRPYAPIGTWYLEPDTTRADEMPDWDRIKAEYRYLLITLPWDPGRIPLSFTTVASNDVAALLELSR